MLEHGASSERCLHVAAQYERKAFIGLLASMGASINELNEEGETPLQVAYKMVLLHRTCLCLAWSRSHKSWLSFSATVREIRVR